MMRSNYLEELHFATLQVLERTGVAFECQEALDILGEAGADIANPDRVKIPSYLVEQALRTSPKIITLYTREGESAITFNGQTGSHFGAVLDLQEDLLKELMKVEKTWFDRVGLKHEYPKRDG